MSAEITQLVSDQTPKRLTLKYHLTFDIDWAPDETVSHILQALNDKNINATFFVTHPSDIVKDLLSSEHNVGFHPNFLPGSSQGKNENDIMEYLFSIVPEAYTLRTHSLVQSSPLFHNIFGNYKQLKIDLSMLMYKFSTIEKFPWAFEDVAFERINYNWEDDAAFFDNSFNWKNPTFNSSVTILDFHPIHIALNSKDNSSYSKLKQMTAGKPLFKTSQQDIVNCQNLEYGTRTCFNAIINSDAQPLSFDDLLCELE